MYLYYVKRFMFIENESLKIKREIDGKINLYF